MKKKDFIIGNWYKIDGTKYYGKLTSEIIDDDKFPSTEYITSNGKYSSNGNYFNLTTNIIEVDISEIAHLLPNNHPDLIIKQEIINDLSYIKPLIKLLEEIKNKEYV